MQRTARCACSAASITVDGEPASGETKIYGLRNAARNTDQQRHFCATCGTTLYWYTSGRPDMVGIAGGCFAEEDMGEPDLSATHKKKFGWVGLPEAWQKILD